MSSGSLSGHTELTIDRRVQEFEQQFNVSLFDIYQGRLAFVHHVLNRGMTWDEFYQTFFVKQVKFSKE